MIQDVLLLTGPCGVGKSSVGFECMELLERAEVAAAMIDSELAYFHPKPAGDKWGYGVAEEGLRALSSVYAASGLTRLLLPRVVEDGEQLGIVERALPDARIRFYRLIASPETIRTRLEKREIGSGLEWHLQRSAEIAQATLGEAVDAEGSVSDIAREVLSRAGWLQAQV